MKSGWATKKLGEVCELINGKNQSAVANPNGKYPIYGSGGVMGRASDFRCPAGCTIIGRKGSINNPLFVNEKFWNVDTAYALSPKDVEAKWVYYFCRSFDFAQLDCGTTIPSLTSTLVKGIDIPIPHLSEQKRIVKKIDAAFEKIDALKANAEKNLANAKELFQSALDEAMRPKKGWVEKRLGEVCSIVSSMVDPTLPKFIKHLHVGGANIVSETGEFVNLQTAKEEGLKSGKYTFDNTMVLYNKIRPYLKKIARPDFAGLCSADMYPLLPNSSIDRDFLYYLLLTNSFTAYAIGESERAGMPKLNQEELFSYKANLPMKLSVQREIVKRLDFLSEKIKLLDHNYTQQIADCAEMRQAILREAFEGRL